jgi:hypothetical protein
MLSVNIASISFVVFLYLVFCVPIEQSDQGESRLAFGEIGRPGRKREARPGARETAAAARFSIDFRITGENQLDWFR